MTETENHAAVHTAAFSICRSSTVTHTAHGLIEHRALSKERLAGAGREAHAITGVLYMATETSLRAASVARVLT